MRPIRILLLATMTLFVLSGCCWTDHSATIKEVAEPMLVELKAFYLKHKRFPTTQERDAMLEKVGCRKVKNKKCIFNRDIIEIERSRITLNQEYEMLLTIENTYCFFGLDQAGKVFGVGCMQQPCIKFGQ